MRKCGIDLSTLVVPSLVHLPLILSSISIVFVTCLP